MRGTEKIIAHIQADAQAQADAILAQAEQQCASVREEYEKKAADLYGEKIRAGVKECQDKLDSQQRIAQMEAKKAVLSVKQDMVARSFSMARRQVGKLPEEQYVQFLARLAAKAASTGEEQIVLSEEDRARVGGQVVQAANALLGNGRMSLAEDAGSFDGGLILRRGNVEVNCTLDLLVELCRGEMSAEIADILFA